MGEELYELPKGWVWVKIGDILEPSAEKVEPSKLQENLAYIGLEHIDKDTGKLLSIGNSIEVRSTKTKFYAGDLLYGKLRPYLNKVHVPNIDGICSTDILVFSKNSYIFGKYIAFRLLCSDFVRFANQNVSGVQHPRVDFKSLSRFIIPLSPLAEQQRIVAKIEELFTQLDAGVELLKKVKAKLKRYRQAVLKAAVEGNLTKEWREANQGELEPASILLERILKQRREKWEAEQLAKMKAQGKTPKDESWKLKYKEPVVPDTSDLPDLPDEWVWTTLELVANAVDPQPSHRTPPTVDGGVPYIGMGDIKDGKIDFENSRKVSIKVLKEHQERYQLKLGDFIFGKIGTLGKPVKISQPFNYTLSANIVLVQPDIVFLNPEFAITYMASPLIETLLQKESRATTQSAFGIQKVRIIPFPLPPSQEQLAIAEELELIFSVTDKLEKTINTNLKRAEKLRQTILKQAFEGKLVPQDPNDEPAEKLLERIKTEKVQREEEKKSKRTTKPKSTKPHKPKTDKQPEAENKPKHQPKIETTQPEKKETTGIQLELFNDS